MFYPSNFVICVTTICEKMIQPTVESKVWLCKNFFLDYMCMSILRSYVSLKSDELKNLHEHTFELVKTLITTYIVLQLKHHMKEGNERIKKNRSGLNCQSLLFSKDNKFFSIIFCLVIMARIKPNLTYMRSSV